MYLCKDEGGNGQQETGNARGREKKKKKSGASGFRSPCLAHAKRALYQLS